MDLQQALVMTQQAYLRARNENANDDRLELLRRFMQQVKTLQDQALAEQMMQQQQMMAPTAEPEGLPTSELMAQTEQPQMGV
jgi:hypothetical protein